MGTTCAPTGASRWLCDLEAVGPSEIAAAIEGADAVVFAAGAGPGSGAERKWTVDRDGAVKLLEAARLAGVQRYLIVSSVGAESPPDDDDVFGVYLRAKAEADAAVDGERPRLDGGTPGAAHRRPSHGSRAPGDRAVPGRGHARRRRGGAGRVPRRARAPASWPYLAGGDDADRSGRRPVSPDARRADDRGPGGRHLAGLEGARLHLRGVSGSPPCSAPITTCRCSGAASAGRSTPGRRSTRSRPSPRSSASARWCRPPPSGIPSELAKVVATADHVSGGRVELGMGRAGSRPSTRPTASPSRRSASACACSRISSSTWPASGRTGRSASRAPLPLRARRAAQARAAAAPEPDRRRVAAGRAASAWPRATRDEYNTVNKTAEECRSIREQLTAACAEAGRAPIPLSLMTGWLAGADQAELLERAGGWPSGTASAARRRTSWPISATLPGRDARRERRRLRELERRAWSGSCSSICCTETSTRSSRSAGRGTGARRRHLGCSRRGRPLDLQGVRRPRHLPGPDGRAARVPDRARVRARAVRPPGAAAVRAARGRRARHAPVGARDGGGVRARDRRRGRRRGRRRDGRHGDALLDGRLARPRRRADVHRLPQPARPTPARSWSSAGRSRCPATPASASCASS